MKKIVSLLVLLCCAAAVWAGPWYNAMLRIREERGRAISVIIDGVRQNTISNNLTVNVAPGMHRIQIVRYNTNGYGYNNGVLAYQGNINVMPGYIYYITTFNQAIDVEENCCLDNYGHWNHNDHWFNPGPVDNWNNNQQWNQHPHPYPQPPINNNTWNNYHGILTHGRYMEIINQMRRNSFETSKNTFATTAIRDVRLNTEQMIGILNEFSFESTKLKFAKENYTRITDPKNYFRVANTFTFQSSKDDLMRFLNGGQIGRPR